MLALLLRLLLQTKLFSWPSQVGFSTGAGVQGTAPQPPPSQSGEYGKIGLLATTGPNGFTLVNGTPNILSWTAPNDGQLHRIFVFFSLNVTSLQTGGNVGITIGSGGHNLAAGGLAAGYQFGLSQSMSAIVLPGQTVLIAETVAQTAGAAVFYGEIWGS